MRTSISRREFAQEFLFPNRPVIIADGLRNWSALDTWTPDYFRDRFGDRVIHVDAEPISVAEFVDHLRAATETKPAPYLKATGPGNYLTDLFPELATDVQPVPEYCLPNWLGEKFSFPLLSRRLNRGPRAEMFFGGCGSGFPVLHWDSLHFHAFNGQVFGEKEWVLYGPDETEHLYPKTNAPNQSEIKDVFAPDLERFPLAAQAQRYQCTMRPGELLFVPAGWWHTTRMMGPSISVAINSANASNWPGVRRELVRKARAKNGLFAAALDFYLGRVEARLSRRDGEV